MSLIRSGSRVVAQASRSALVANGAPSSALVGLQQKREKHWVTSNKLLPITYPEYVRKFIFSASGFNQYGLYADDIRYEYDDVKEALRRLPPKLMDERNFRIHRAMQCYLTKTVLPKDQWPTFEENEKHGRYLTPYIEEVNREIDEESRWNAK